MECMQPLDKALKIARCLEEKKGRDILLLEVGPLSSLGDYFVIVDGSSAPHIKAMADFVKEELTKAGEAPPRSEGYTSASWILMDYGDVIVHVFQRESREFYGIERLWEDAKRVPFTAED